MLFIKSSFTLSLSLHVISCSCTSIYAAFFFLFVLLKTHESKRSYSRSELADALLILFPPPTCGFTATVRKRASAARWSKISSSSQPEGRSHLRRADFFSAKTMALNGDRIECSTLMSVWLPPQLGHISVFRLSGRQTQVQTDADVFTCMPIFSPSFFFSLSTTTGAF